MVRATRWVGHTSKGPVAGESVAHPSTWKTDVSGRQQAWGPAGGDAGSPVGGTAGQSRTIDL